MSFQYIKAVIVSKYCDKCYNHQRSICLYKKVKVYIKELTPLSIWSKETSESGEKIWCQGFCKNLSVEKC